MLRVCVIGLGPIGNRHADIYVENPLSELVGVCDIDENPRQCGRTTSGRHRFLQCSKNA